MSGFRNTDKWNIPSDEDLLFLLELTRFDSKILLEFYAGDPRTWS